MVASKHIHLGFIAFTVFLLSRNPTPITASASGAQQHQIEFEYKTGTKLGPENWGYLKPEWKICKNGKFQSPIDLRDRIATKVNSGLEHFQISYKPANATLKNEGHALSVVWQGNAGSIKINGTEYTLRQCHWHSPSEHTINGKRYEMELHMVHKGKNNNDVAVVGFLYKIGQPNPFISQMTKAIASTTNVVKEVHLGVIDPRKMKKAQDKAQNAQQRKMRKASSKFYRYKGSYTTPPCTEGVTWTINKQVHTISPSQLKLFRNSDFDYALRNARPVQPLYGRVVKLHGSSFTK